MNIALELLNGWKEIARYLGTSIRSAQRYERLGGLPIRRPTGQSRGAVLATKSELDAWVNASPLKDAFSLKAVLPQDYAASLKVFKVGMAEQRRLRGEMAREKEELRTALELLRASLSIVQDESAGRLERRATGALSSSLKIM